MVNLGNLQEKLGIEETSKANQKKVSFHAHDALMASVDV